MKKNGLAIGLLLAFSFFVAFVCNFIFQYSLWLLDFQVTTDYFFGGQFKLILFGSILIWFFFLFIYGVTGKYWTSIMILSMVSIIIGIANYKKMITRVEPVYPYEASMIKNVKFLSSMVEGNLIIKIVVGIVIIVALTIILELMSKRIKKRFDVLNFSYLNKKFLIFRGVIVIVSAFVLFQMYTFNNENNFLNSMSKKLGATWITYDQSLNYRTNTFLMASLYNMQIVPMKLEDKAAYSQEKMEELVEKYTKKADKINSSRTNKQLEDINIVYVMSESFSDPLKIEGLEWEDDPIPYTREIMEKHTSGQNLSEKYGGGTANIEFEALTNFSMYPFTSQLESPYQMLIEGNKHFPSVIDYYSNFGYISKAIHPYNVQLYKRTDVYRAFGFDEFIFDETMTHTDHIGASQYISDESAFNEVLDQLEGEDKSQFIHLVTMQNHWPYQMQYGENLYKVNGASTKEEKNMLETYAQGLKFSDNALRGFVESLENSDEKTMVVFWGDHLPAIYSDEIFEENDTRTMYQTPLFFYTNYEVQKEELNTISPIFLMNHILSLNDVKVDPFYALLYELEKELPAFEKFIMINSDDEVIEENDLTKEQQEVLEDYILFQYDQTTGNKYADKMRIN